MKHKSHKLLSLLLAFALMFSLVPSALAVDEAEDGETHTHKYVETVTKKPTCTEKGSKDLECACGDKKTEEIEALGHDWGEGTQTKAPTCTETGITTYTCSRSGCKETKPETVKALGHDYKYQEINSDIHLVKCSRCNYGITESHKFSSDGKPCVCGEKNPNINVEISPTSCTLEVGKTTQLTATATGATGSRDVDWSSSKEEVATVKNGLVTAKSKGTTIITATAKNEAGKEFSATCTVTVTDDTPVTNVLSTSVSRVNIASGDWSSRIIANAASGYSGYSVHWNASSRIRIATSTNASDYSSALTTGVGDSVYVYGLSSGSATLTARLYDGSTPVGNEVTITVTVDSETLTLTKNPNTSYVNLYYYNDYYYDDWYWDRYDDWYYDRYYYGNYSQQFSVTPYLNNVNIYNSSDYTITYTWTLNSHTEQSASSASGASSCTIYASNSYLNRNSRNNTLRCTVNVYNRGTTSGTPLYSKSAEWAIYTDYNYSYNDYTVSATVYDTSSGYEFDERDDKNGSSIITQMNNRFSGSETVSYVRFSSVSSTYGKLDASTSYNYYYDSSRNGDRDLRDVTFTPSRIGTASFDCTVYGTRGSSYRCTIGIKVEAGSSSSAKGDIEYTARAGNEVDFSASDFRSWWRDNYRNGDLDYVRFTSTSSGNLYADYNSSSDRGTNVVSSSTSNATSCYYSPSSRQTGINDLTFVPGSSSSSSVTIRFTAYGTTSSSSSSSTSMTGRVVITYTNASASTITYNTTGTKSVTLSSSDFTGRYRDVVGSSAPSNMTIRFTSVPTNGNLTIGNTTLTSSNISSYNFSSSSSGSNRISDVKYTPKSNSNSSDSVKYDCYSGSTLRFSGTITFSNKADNTTSVTTGVTVSYSTTGSSVTFSPSDFYNKNSAMLSATYLTFGAPSSGTLYVGSTPVSSGTQFAYVSNPAASYQNLGSLTYRPAAGFNGTATISFTAYNANGTQAATGTVNILVSQSSGTTTPATPNRTSFGDVPSTAWYYTDVTTLAQANIVNGRNDGLFHPNDTVNYGEALKLILLAAGYPQQQELSGAVWAQNYLNQAITNKLLDGAAADYTLSAAMDRNTIATVAAKALKLTPVTSGASPYADTSDSYVLALTNAGIVQGDSSSGKQLWNGADNLTRAQISRIVYNIYKYRNVAPGSTSSTGSTGTIDTNAPGWL